jgi:hypothetical protein
MRASRGMPKWPKIGKREERSIAALLSRLPLSAPGIEIRPLAGKEFEAEFREAGDCYIALEPGSWGFQAEYDCRNGEFLEAEVQQIARRVRALRKWACELRSIGGCCVDGPFQMLWREADYYRVNPDCTYQFHETWTSPRFPRHLAMRGEITWDGPETAQGPDEACGVVAGFNTVVIAGREYDCIRAFTLWTADPDPDKAADWPKWDWLDEAYISGEGRTVLHRRYETRAHHNEMAEHCMQRDVDWPDERPHIAYNGVDFFGLFDTLTDVALAGVGSEN